MNETRFCPQCGSPVAEGHAFCAKCGSPQNTGTIPGGQPMQTQQYAPQPAYYQPQPQYGSNPQYAPRKSARALVALSIIILGLAAAAAALAFVLGPYAAKPADLNGVWYCTFTPTQVLNGDTDYISSDDVGEDEKGVMKIDLKSNGDGTILVEGLTFNAAYKDGNIAAASMADEYMEFSFEGALEKTNSGYKFGGTWKFTIVKGADKGEIARGTWTASLDG